MDGSLFFGPGADGGMREESRKPAAVRSPGSQRACAVPHPVWVAAILALLSFAGPGCHGRPDPPALGAKAPSFELRDLENRLHRLESFAGRVVVLNFWATWCPPCVEEMPSLQRLEDILGDEGLVVVGVSVDERYADIAPFVAEHELRFLVLHDLGKRVSRRYEVFQFPETWIIRRDGRLASHIVGARDWAAPESLGIFRELLAEPRGGAPPLAEADSP